MNTPIIKYRWNLRDSDPKQQSQSGWWPARPMSYRSGLQLFHRLRLAWMVFTGKADALKWEPPNTKVKPFFLSPEKEKAAREVPKTPKLIAAYEKCHIYHSHRQTLKWLESRPESGCQDAAAIIVQLSRGNQNLKIILQDKEFKAAQRGFGAIVASEIADNMDKEKIEVNFNDDRPQYKAICPHCGGYIQ